VRACLSLSLDQGENASKAVEWFMSQRFKMTTLSNVALWHQDVSAHLQYISDKNNVKKSEIHVVGLFDLNTAWARTKVRVKHVASAVAALHAEHVNRAVCIVSLPDIPVRGALKAFKGTNEPTNLYLNFVYS